MILLDDLVAVGRFAKTHGVQGEVNVDFDVDVDLDECEYFVVEMDGIPVPFFLDDYRFRSDVTALVRLDGIDTEPKARQFFGKTIYVEPNHIDAADEGDASYYLGYLLKDASGAEIGKITAIDDTTANILFEVGEHLIPAAAIEVINNDEDRRIMIVSLPEGLLDIASGGSDDAI